MLETPARDPCPHAPAAWVACRHAGRQSTHVARMDFNSKEVGRRFLFLGFNTGGYCTGGSCCQIIKVLVPDQAWKCRRVLESAQATLDDISRYREVTVPPQEIRANHTTASTIMTR
jgi:hypothetical protein